MDNSKGQKIIAALYLVTNHLPESDPIRRALRDYAVKLFEEVEEQTKESVVSRIDSLLVAAIIAKLISEKNGSIIRLELRHFSQQMRSDQGGMLSTLFTTTTLADNSKRHFEKKSNHTLSPSFKNVPQIMQKSQIINENKDDRRAKILSFINDRKSAAIKDITTLFPDLSDKTVQRELGVLVAKGLITKRGSKRWSVYMAVAA